MPSLFAILPDGKLICSVHFAYWSASQEDEDVPQWRVACAPNANVNEYLGLPPHPWHRTNDPRAATCPVCLQTPVFQEAMRRLEC
jgi:hypothetical protein